jgi:hypothetical protein
MKKALLHSLEPGRICQIVDSGNEFEVAPSFSWVDVPDDTTYRDTWDTENNAVKKYNILEDPVFLAEGYKVARGIAYKPIGDQLDMIYKEVQANGTISNTGAWATHIANVKATIPKDDPAAVLAWNEELRKSLENKGTT